MSVEYKAIPQIAKGGWLEKKCFWCGCMFKADEAITLLVVSSKYKTMYKKLASNIVMHTAHFDGLVNKYGQDNDSLLVELGNHATPRIPKSYTERQLLRQRAFREVAKIKGFSVETETGNEIRRRKNKTSLTLKYNKNTDKVGFDYRGNKGMFDIFFVQQIISEVENGIREMTGEDLGKTVNAKVEIEKLHEQVLKDIGLK